MATVHLDQITRQYGPVKAVEDITFKIPEGEFWVFVGPSGCGKSTILRIIAGLETASSGNVYIGNRLVNAVPARQRDVAMVFQNYALYPHMTVAENLAFGLRMRQANPSTIQTQIDQVARSLAIDHLLNRKPKQLSGGQQQRVALGRAIIRQPQVFLLDEPLSNLDAQLRDDTRAELKQLHQRLGITTVYVTHDQVEAMTLADQIVVLDRGRVQQIGPPQTVYAQPANQMVARFLGNPAMNLLPAVYGNSLFWLGQQSLSCSVDLQDQLHPYEGQHLNLGIRPEHITWVPAENPSENIPTAAQLLNHAPLKVEVDLMEPLGREVLIRAHLLEANSSTLIQFQGPAEAQFQPGDRIIVHLDLARLFVFDPQTGIGLFD
ncbi:MAG: ABC transporter ATP-binding protein [Oscillatoriales cyanobacterium RM2_1_1]|nr:ABC transporter ATP-binding protein [Oscillatoriales cyanobacterium SM2_3_0]NJO44666.1 ABC transporter ATP-binding protein [Oscillatoriales cyanobacterium RM2_1_1]